MGVGAGLVDIVLVALWLMLPCYLSNMLPVFVGGGPPIDMGKSWRDGKRLLGDGKTWRALLLAPLLAAVLTLLLQLISERTAWGAWGFVGWGPWAGTFLLAYMMGFGALAGDAVESFFKRRTGRERGDRWIPFDQLDFVVGGLVFAFLGGWLLEAIGVLPAGHISSLFTWPRVIAIVLLTPALHLLVNYLGYKIGAKDVPW